MLDDQEENEKKVRPRHCSSSDDNWNRIRKSK